MPKTVGNKRIDDSFFDKMKSSEHEKPEGNEVIRVRIPVRRGALSEAEDYRAISHRRQASADIVELAQR
jgi:hypothetical protein